MKKFTVSIVFALSLFGYSNLFSNVSLPVGVNEEGKVDLVVENKVMGLVVRVAQNVSAEAEIENLPSGYYKINITNKEGASVTIEIVK